MVEWRTEGLAGTIIQVAANHVGLDHRAWSVPDDSPIVEEPWPLYVVPPELATGVAPVAFLFYTDYLPSSDDCDNLDKEGTFSFVSSIGGTYHILCDTNEDGVFDPMALEDVHLVGAASAGFNQVDWDGTTAASDPVPPDTYSCQIVLAPLEVHALLTDAETGFSGVRMFRSDPAQPSVSLPMFFQDEAVAAGALVLPNGTGPLDQSPPAGLASGDPLALPMPLGNSRSWGAFTTSGKGDRATLDTWSWLDPVTSPSFDIQVVALADRDNDGLGDLQEECFLCTDPDDADTDDDNLLDGIEVGLGIDPCNPDTDGDSIPDDVEVVDPLLPPDTDGDGDINANDPDDDGDQVPTIDEAYDGITDPRLQFTDGDALPDYLDPDDDGDDLLTFPTEDVDNNGDPRNDDTDGDGIPDYLDPFVPPVVTGATGDTGAGDTASDTGVGDTSGGTGVADTSDSGPIIVITGATGGTGDTGGVIVIPTGDTGDTNSETGDTGGPNVTGDTSDTGSGSDTSETGGPFDTGDTSGGVIILPTGDTSDTGDSTETGDPQGSGDTGETMPTGDTSDTSEVPTSGDTGAALETGDTAPVITLPTGETGETGEPTFPETADTADTPKDTGDPVVVTEHYEGGCSGCTNGSMDGAWAWLALLPLLGRRRRSA